MITLPNGLNAFMKGQKLDGLKPFALLYRNKWDSVNNKYALEDTPIDISALIAKPNTLSMTLDVNEVAQYNANNVTLTLSDTKNYFVEGTPNSYFPDGYQIYGSRIVLYYGTDGVNRTPLFTGVIKDLPTHKPENYQVDVKLVSPLEMLKDIEAKDFSDKVTGETLTYKSTDSDGHRIYWTTGTGVGGFDGVYANGTKLFEGVDYETDQLNALGLQAIVTIINSDYYSATITADYYTWKTGLTVEQIVAGLVGLAGYDSGTEDIRNVVWNTAVRTSLIPSPKLALGYYQNGADYKFSYINPYTNSTNYDSGLYLRGMICKGDFRIDISDTTARSFIYGIADSLVFNSQQSKFVPQNGINIYADYSGFIVEEYINGSITRTVTLIPYYYNENYTISIERTGNTTVVTATSHNNTGTITTSAILNVNYEGLVHLDSMGGAPLQTYKVTALSSGNDIGELTKKGQILFDITDFGAQGTLDSFVATFSNSSNYTLSYRYGNSFTALSNWATTSLGASIGVTGQYFQFMLELDTDAIDVSDVYTYFLSSTLTLQLVNLSGLTVLEALQDFALISGYKFGVDRQGVFFFRPRVSSTTPTYILDHDEIVKVDTVKKNLSDFFTKLTLTFAQVPLEFYANTGERPTLVDKYGIINKEIDKPDIVNYDNPELAQAIGPQLLEVYSALPNIIQVTGKLNLSLELGDIVSLRRNMNLITPEGYTDYSKYTDLNTYYRACKITGMNYNFSKRQITYTLRDVSNKNTEPQYEFNEYIYDLAVQYGVKE